MKKYRVLVRSFIGGSLVEPGAVIEYDGKPGSNLELVKEEKRKPAGKAAESVEETTDDSGGQAEQGGDVI